jgi:hypothetical protein
MVDFFVKARKSSSFIKGMAWIVSGSTLGGTKTQGRGNA